MLTIGIDTTTKYTCIALSKNGNLLAHKEAELGRAQSDLLAKFVADILTECKTNLSEIDMITVANGPGYYTGIRTGIAYAAALAKAIDKKNVTACTLETFIFDQRINNAVYIPVLKARYDSVYAAAYKAEKGILSEIFAPVYIHASELAEKIKAMPDAVLVGADIERYTELSELPNKIIKREFAPDGQIALIGEKYADCAVSPEAVRGNYLREPDIGATR